jgi:predicted metal-dependent hydrolase
MASKSFEIDGIGKITVYKRRKSKRLSMRLVGNNIKVSQPVWLPYAAGQKFVMANKGWIEEQKQIKPNLEIYSGMLVGKTRVLRYIPDSNKLSSRVSLTHVFIYVPVGVDIHSAEVHEQAKKAIKRALKKEAELLLPNRVAKIANETGYSYKKLAYKSMRSRWGSCTTNKDISLNIFLMMMPWEQIDYVILHELTHTKHLHHASNFWDAVEQFMPDYKIRRKVLKESQTSILALQQ